MKFVVFLCAVLLVCLGSACGSSSSNATRNLASSSSDNVNSANVTVIVPSAKEANPANIANSNQTPVKVVVPQGNPKPMTFPAPDDSEYSTSMDKSGEAIETRVFHSDPLILKVERIWKSVSDKVVNIYLKNGKVVKVAGDKWPDIKSQPVGVFYDAAGVKPPAPPAQEAPVIKKAAKPKQ